MAFNNNQFGRDIAAPGLVFPDTPYDCESGCMADSSTLEGGFALYRIPGEDVPCYATKPASVSQVKRVLELTPVIAVAGVGTVKIRCNGVVIASASTTAETTVATLIDGLVSGLAASAGYVFDDGTTKLTITAKEYGAQANSDVFAVEYSADSGFSGSITQTTAGVTAKEGGYFRGVAQRIVTRDEYPAGTPVSIITKGKVWVLVSDDVQSGKSAYTCTAGWGNSSSTGAEQVSNGKYVTSAPAGGFAVLELL